MQAQISIMEGDQRTEELEKIIVDWVKSNGRPNYLLKTSIEAHVAKHAEYYGVTAEHLPGWAKLIFVDL